MYFLMYFFLARHKLTLNFLHTPMIALQIIWSNRLVQDDSNRYSTMTVDGIDFKINEPYPFNPMCFSHKFESARVR
jgi:hypothetical protein